MWNTPLPPSELRQTARFGTGLLLVLKGPEKARSLRRSAKRMPEGIERDARFAAADWLDWAAANPRVAVREVEAAWDAIQADQNAPSTGAVDSIVSRGNLRYPDLNRYKY
jgi:hypothetical protein